MAITGGNPVCFRISVVRSHFSMVMAHLRTQLEVSFSTRKVSVECVFSFQGTSGRFSPSYTYRTIWVKKRKQKTKKLEKIFANKKRAAYSSSKRNKRLFIGLYIGNKKATLELLHSKVAIVILRVISGMLVIYRLLCIVLENKRRELENVLENLQPLTLCKSP